MEIILKTKVSMSMNISTHAATQAMEMMMRYCIFEFLLLVAYMDHMILFIIISII